MTEKFSDYLYYGPPFEVFTDNNPLTHVMTSAKLNACRLRWVAQLANYQFMLKFRSGKSHVDANYLSRVPEKGDVNDVLMNSDAMLNTDEVNIVLSGVKTGCEISADGEILILKTKDLSGENPINISKEELGETQEVDKLIGPVYKMLKLKYGVNYKKAEQRNACRKTKTLAKQKANLYFEGKVLMRKIKNYRQIVLPQVYKPLVFRELHEKLGHIGSEKVIDLARRGFYWPNMQDDVEFYVRNKGRCIMSKRPLIPDRAALVPIRTTYPFEMVSIDYLHLDRAKGGYEYALVVCDHFTRFTQIYATKNKSAIAAADKTFNEFILNYGFPTRRHHDQGREFENKLFKRLHHLTGIASSKTTPYHPMGDGHPNV